MKVGLEPEGQTELALPTPQIRQSNLKNYKSFVHLGTPYQKQTCNLLGKHCPVSSKFSQKKWDNPATP